MKLQDALKEAQGGKIIARAAWKNKFVFIQNALCPSLEVIVKCKGKKLVNINQIFLATEYENEVELSSFVPSVSDLICSDWQIL